MTRATASSSTPRATGDRIQALCAGARLIKPTVCGHTRLLAARELEEAVADFLA